MKLTIQIPDEKYEQLEGVALQQGKTVESFIQEGIDFLKQLNHLDNQILLQGKDVSSISATVGGKTLRTAEEIVKLFQDNFKVRIGDIELQLDVEDAHALQAQFQGGAAGGLSFEDYVCYNIRDALSMYLWGSTRGLVIR